MGVPRWQDPEATTLFEWQDPEAITPFEWQDLEANFLAVEYLRKSYMYFKYNVINASACIIHDLYGRGAWGIHILGGMYIRVCFGSRRS